MALTRVDLSIELTVSDDCTYISLEDTTSDYGGSGKITANNVTSVVITVNISGGSYFTYTFTVLNGTITAATLSLSGATATNILSELESTVWPFTSFNLWGDYGVTLPDLADGVVEVDYEITGTGNGADGPESFDYTTSVAQTIKCVSVCCCLTKMGQQIDPNCNCEDCLWNYLKADAYLTLASMQTNIGNTDRAALFITKAQSLCDCDC